MATLVSVAITGSGFVSVPGTDDKSIQRGIIDAMIEDANRTLLYLEKHAPKSRPTKTAPDGLYVNRGDRNKALVTLALLRKLNELRDTVEFRGALS